MFSVFRSVLHFVERMHLYSLFWIAPLVYRCANALCSMPRFPFSSALLSDWIVNSINNCWSFIWLCSFSKHSLFCVLKIYVTRVMKTYLLLIQCLSCRENINNRILHSNPPGDSDFYFLLQDVGASRFKRCANFAAVQHRHGQHLQVVSEDCASNKVGSKLVSFVEHLKREY